MCSVGTISKQTFTSFLKIQPPEINFFSNIFKELMSEIIEIEFDRAWHHLKDSVQFHNNEVVINYFEKNLLPAFKTRSSIWLLKSIGVENPDNGLTNNASESMNAVLHSLQNWKQVPLDIICVSIFHLTSFYYKETERAIHQCGSCRVYALSKRPILNANND